MTLSEGQGHWNWFQKSELSSFCCYAFFFLFPSKNSGHWVTDLLERSISVQMQATIEALLLLHVLLNTVTMKFSGPTGYKSSNIPIIIKIDRSLRDIWHQSFIFFWTLVVILLILSYLSCSLADRWGTTVDSTTSFLPSSRFSAFRDHSGRYKNVQCSNDYQDAHSEGNHSINIWMQANIKVF